MTNSAIRLWQLISPALPVGAYSYSQGLETAVEQGYVTSEAEVLRWVSGQLSHALAALDVPVMQRLYNSWQQQDSKRFHHWNVFLLAARESKELRDEDQQMGAALQRLMPELCINKLDQLNNKQYAFASLFCVAAVDWQIELTETIQGYLWSWSENQVMAAIKLIPLGQSAGQRVLLKVADLIPPAIEYGLSLADDDIGQTNVGAVLCSMQHETQYTRLFRS